MTLERYDEGSSEVWFGGPESIYADYYSDGDVVFVFHGKHENIPAQIFKWRD